MTLLWLLAPALALVVTGGWLAYLAHDLWCDHEHEPPVWVEDLAGRRW